VRLLPRLLASRAALWTAFLVVHLGLGLLALHAYGWPLGDVEAVYRFWADQSIIAGYTVGIDAAWVYPILALPFMLLPALGGHDGYPASWLTMIVVLDAVALAAITGWGAKTARVRAGWWWLLFLAALGPIAVARIDAVTVAVALVGVALLASRPPLAGAVLAAATWIKVWPAALVLAAVLALRDRWRIVAVGTMLSVVIVALALASGSGLNVLSFVTQQTGRGLQVESPLSTPWLWGVVVGAPGSQVYYDQGILTFQVAGAGDDLAAALATPLLAVVVLAIALLAIRGVRAGADQRVLLPPVALALVMAFLTVNKVGSPQFASWLAVPVVLGLLWDAAGWRVPLVLAPIAALLTQAVYPYLYHLVLAADPLMVTVLTARNALYVVLLVWAVRRVALLGRRTRVRGIRMKETA